MLSLYLRLYITLILVIKWNCTQLPMLEGFILLLWLIKWTQLKFNIVIKKFKKLKSKQ